MIKHRQHILDRNALDATLATAQEQALPSLLRDYHRAGEDTIRQRFFATPQGLTNARERSWLIDQLCQGLMHTITTRLNATADIALAAIGGYGRGQLSPHSDIDLLFLYRPEAKAAAEAVTTAVLYPLWDTKLQLGHSLVTPDEALAMARSDRTMATSLLDARFIAGDIALFSDFTHHYHQQVMQGQAAPFIRAKLDERNERHQRLGDSRYVLEPNVKESKGALRDLHTLWWITKFTYKLAEETDLSRQRILTPSEYRIYTQAREFLLKTRACMHYARGRGENLLTFDLQREVADQLHYRADTPNKAVERFMKSYFLTARQVGNLTRTLCAQLEAEKTTRKAFPLPAFVKNLRHLDGFPLEGARLTLPSEISLSDDPVVILRLFRASQKHKLDIHPAALRAIQQQLKLIDRSVRLNAEANRLFLDILVDSSPATLTLKRMNEAGVLGVFLPDFGRIIGQMQFDMYHSFTVDEHTLTAIGMLGAIARGDIKHELPLASDLIHRIPRKHVLYLGLLLHDVAKGRGGDHSSAGEKIARQLCPRLGLNKTDTDTVAWLVAQHLLFSQTAFKRDLASPDTIRAFVAEVQTLERLTLLLLLTVADIRAVGPKIWNGWKGALLRELYQRAATALGADRAEEDMLARAKSMQTTLSLHISHWPEAERTRYLAQPNTAFWLGFSEELHHLFAELWKEAIISHPPITCEISQHAFHATTDIVLCCPAVEGLTARLAGCCASAGLSIVSARSFSLPDKMALAIFSLQTQQGTPVEDQGKIARLLAGLHSALMVDKTHISFVLPAPKLSARMRAFVIDPLVTLDNDLSADHTVIEVTARDRLGLLYDIAQKCSELGLSIAATHVATYGEKAVDVFYVQNIFGLKITDPANQELIRTSLLSVLRT